MPEPMNKQTVTKAPWG